MPVKSNLTRALELAAMVLIAAGSRLGAQTITGVVRDSLTAEALAGTTVELFTPDGKMAARDLTDEHGFFSLRAPVAGTFRLRFQRIGYRAVFSNPLLISGQDTAFGFRLLPLAIPVASVAVTATTQSYLANVGFNERRKTEAGYFLDPMQVGKRATKARQTADLLDGIPGVTLLVAGGSWGIRVPALTRAVGCEPGPRIYLDGHLTNPAGTVFDVNAVNTEEIAAIEVYRHTAEVPLKFGGTQADCGVLVIWTKH